MWIDILQGVGFGMAAASQPGPFRTYLIFQSLINGWRRTLSAAIILGFGLASRFGPFVSRAMLGISTPALLLFGVFQIFKALA